MSENIKKIILILLITLSLIQVILYNNSINKFEEVNNTIVHDETKNIKSLYEELGYINKEEIISAQKENDVWNIKIMIDGNTDNIINEISKLKDLKILNYSIRKNLDEKCVIVEISGK